MYVDADQLPSLLSDSYHVLKQSRDESSVSQIPAEQFKTVLNCYQKLLSCRDPSIPPLLSGLAEIYLEILSECSLPQENQLMASTAFCHILSLIQTPTNIALLFSKNFMSATSDLFQVKLLKGQGDVNVYLRKPEVFKVCLCHGLLQLGDTFWTSQHLDWKQLMFSKILNLIESHAFTLTPLTLPAFKCLRLFLMKVNQTNKLSRKIDPTNLIRIAKIVFSNWENPMSGVREQNSLVFEAFLDASSDSLQSPHRDISSHDPSRYLEPVTLMELVFTEQSWMTKSKYFMLSALLHKNSTSKVLMSLSNDIVAGLLNSLSYQHLVSAGAELYKVCLQDINFEQWQQIFLQPILQVLTSNKTTCEKQNLINHWMPCTMKKFKACIQIIVENLTECRGYSCDDILYALVSCYKLGRKEGLEKMQWKYLSEYTHLKQALKQSNDQIRMQAFATVCISPKSSTVPTDEEFDLIQSFLSENINCNNTALRHSMLSSFYNFLARMTDVCLHILQNRFHQDASHAENRALTRSMMFLEWLYNFLKSNLEIGTNYQRRVSSLEMYKVILSYLTEDSVPTLVQRRSSVSHDRHIVMKYAVRVSKWNFTTEASREMLLYCISDPSDDVREAAATLLITYFKINDDETNRIAELYKKALSMCSDPLFYYAESGALLVQVLTCLVYKNGGQSALKTFGLTTKDEKVSSTLLSLAQSQGVCLRSDLLKAASQGSPMHGILRALERLILEPSSPEYNKLSQAERLKLITLLESTTNHLLSVLSSKSSSVSEFAPSFSEIGEALENVIVESSITVEESDKHRLSPSYQLLINCIWLNLRICCNLATGIVSSYGVQGLGGISEAWRCAEICLSVLRQCRHKGAIESAGVSLGACVGVLSEAGHLSEIQSELSNTLSGLSDRQISSSTRAAGQVTIIHRLAACQHKSSRPLVELCVAGLVSVVDSEAGDSVQALQALTNLVQDSSLTQDMAKHYYSLAIVSLNAISSQVYPIRNGGLTLLGALVPKLVGQRKKHDDDTFSFSRLPYEELYLHSPDLVERLIQELSTSEPGRLLACLTLVSNLTVGVLTCIDRSLIDIHQRLQDATRNLLSAKWYSVRNQAASSDAWLTRPTQLASLTQQRLWPISVFLTDRSVHTDITSENQLHGFLLNTKYIVQRFNHEKIGNTSVQQQTKQFDLCFKTIDQISVANFTNISYVCRAVLAELSKYNESKPANRQIEDVLAAINRSTAKPHSSIGLYNWTANEISKIINNCPLDNLVPSLYTCLIHNENHELHQPCISSLQPIIVNPEFKNYSSEILNILGHYVAIRVESVDCTEVLEIILDILIRNKDLTGFSPENLIKALTGDTDKYRVKLASVSITVLCALLAYEWNHDIAQELSDKIFDNSDSSEKDEETRYNTARGLALLAQPALNWKSEDSSQVKISLWNSAVILLQDENPRIRNEASKFVSKLNDSNLIWNPQVSLEFLFDVPTLSKLLPMKEIVYCLWSNLKCQPMELIRLDLVNSNSVISPFELGISNIYAENIKIVDMSFNSLYNIVTNQSESIKILSSNEIYPHLPELKEHCLKITKFYGDYLMGNNTMLTSDWYIITKKICCMHKIINYVNNVLVDKELEQIEKLCLRLLEQKL